MWADVSHESDRSPTDSATRCERCESRKRCNVKPRLSLRGICRLRPCGNARIEQPSGNPRIELPSGNARIELRAEGRRPRSGKKATSRQAASALPNDMNPVERLGQIQYEASQHSVLIFVAHCPAEHGRPHVRRTCDRSGPREHRRKRRLAVHYI